MSGLAALFMMLGILYSGESHPTWVRFLAGVSVGISISIIFHAIKASRK